MTPEPTVYAAIRPDLTRRTTRRLILMLLATGGLNCSRSEPPPSGARASDVRNPVSLVVTTFATGDSTPLTWNAAAFADSLASRLQSLPSVHVSVTSDAGSGEGFVLRGNVAGRNGRLVIGVRLSHAADSAPAWSATFWRSSGPLSSLVNDVASGAAEALGAEMARRSMLKQERK